LVNKEFFQSLVKKAVCFWLKTGFPYRILKEIARMSKRVARDLTNIVSKNYGLKFVRLQRACFKLLKVNLSALNFLFKVRLKLKEFGLLQLNKT
jgi:hypothetical protein